GPATSPFWTGDATRRPARRPTVTTLCVTERISTGRSYIRPAVLYDSDCGFCKWLLSILLRWDRAERLRPVALQSPEAGDLLRELTPAARMASWHLVSPTGELRSGG